MTVPISAAARLLGFAGLLPQLFAVLLIVSGGDAALGALMALAYALMIFSFLGGIWWGFAMRSGGRQPALVGIAVVPMLIAFSVVVGRLLGLPIAWALVAIGALLFLTLLIDRQLVADDIAPPGWMTLRIPLSLGLGALTILAGATVPGPISVIYSG